MSLPQPKGGFKWKQVMPTKEQMIGERKLEDRVDLGGGLGVSRGTPQISQQLPARAREKRYWGRAHAKVTKKND